MFAASDELLDVTVEFSESNRPAIELETVVAVAFVVVILDASEPEIE